VAFKLRYVNFWPALDPHNFVLTKVLEKIIGNEVVIVKDNTSIVDLEFHSVFTFSSQSEKAKLILGGYISEKSRREYELRTVYSHSGLEKSPSKKKIWFTGENKRAPLSGFDATISFDPTDETFNNLYFPYWMCRIDWGIGSKGYEIMPTVQSMLSSREYIQKDLQVCTFSSQIDLIRERISRSVMDRFEVDEYGSRHGRRVLSKLTTSKDYLFQICTENSFYPGYVTEKLQEAWFARNIPIWSGLQNIPYFNPDAFVDLTGKNHQEIVEILFSITEEKVHSMQTSPILQIEPSLGPLENLLAKII
jgi:hypothetical protein